MKKWIITLIALVFLYMILVGQSSAYLDGWQAAYFGVQTQNSQYFNTYVVKKGDTLAEIAQEYLGDYRKWQLLVEINHLKIIDNNVVIIYPGQIIKLFKFTEEDIERYRQATKTFIENWVLQTKNLHKTPNSEPARGGMPYNHAFMYAEIEYHKEVIYTLRRRATKMYVGEIYQRALEMGRGKYPFLTGELWQKERQAALLLIAIGWQESSYKYIYGQHEEVGWFQIKPMTAYITTKEIWKEMDKKEALFLIKRKLMDDPKFVMVIVGKLLEKYPTFMEALAEGYNKGQHKHLYAKSVLSKYYKLRQKVEED